MTIVIAVSFVIGLVYLLTAGTLIIIDKLRMVSRQAALDWLEIWAKYHEKRIAFERPLRDENDNS